MKRPQVVGNICRACEPPELTLQPCLPQPKAPCPLSDTCKYFESRTSSPLNPYLGLVLDLFLKVVHQCLNKIAQKVCEWIPCCACHGSMPVIASTKRVALNQTYKWSHPPCWNVWCSQPHRTGKPFSTRGFQVSDPGRFVRMRCHSKVSSTGPQALTAKPSPQPAGCLW